MWFKSVFPAIVAQWYDHFDLVPPMREEGYDLYR
jgi:hypothetical protein